MKSVKMDNGLHGQFVKVVNNFELGIAARKSKILRVKSVKFAKLGYVNFKVYPSFFLIKNILSIELV